VAPGDATTGVRLGLAHGTAIVRWMRLLAWVAVARIAVVVLGWATQVLVPASPSPQTWYLLSRETLLDGWLRWDVGWILLTAKTGYSAVLVDVPPGRLPLPVIALVGRALELAGVPIEVELLAVCNLASIVGMAMVLSSAKRDRSGGAIALLAMGPWALVAVAPFPEALLLLVLGLGFTAVERGRWTTAALAGSLAWLTAASGPAVWLGLVVASRRVQARRCVWAGASAVGPILAVAFSAYVARQSGEPAARVVEAIWGLPVAADWHIGLAALSGASAALPVAVIVGETALLVVLSAVRARDLGADKLCVAIGSLALGAAGGPATLARAAVTSAAAVAARVAAPPAVVAAAGAALAIVVALFGGWYPWTGSETGASPTRDRLSAAYPELRDRQPRAEGFVAGEVTGEVAILDWRPTEEQPQETRSVAGALVVAVRRPTSSHLAASVRASDASGAVVASGDYALGASTWQRGLKSGDEFEIPVLLGIDANVPAGILDLTAYIFELPGYSLVQTTDPTTGRPVTVRLESAVIARPGKLWPELGAVETPLASFDGGLDLMSARATCHSDRGECTVDATLRKSMPLRERYTVFVHVLDSHGALLGQSDSYPLDGRLPTDAWPVGYAAHDHRSIAIRSTSAASTIRLGLYVAETGRRVRLIGPPAMAGQDSVQLLVTAP